MLSLRPQQVEIVCDGTGMNTDSLMEEAIRRKMNAAQNRTPYESIWVVFDKDDFTKSHFYRAFDLAKGQGDIIPCWSNECFEIWYLLHFCFRITAIGRNELFRELSKRLGKKYDKSDKTVFQKLANRIDDALRNAGKLEFEKRREEDYRGNPSTRVHELVKMLRALDPEKQHL